MIPIQKQEQITIPNDWNDIHRLSIHNLRGNVPILTPFRNIDIADVDQTENSGRGIFPGAEIDWYFFLDSIDDKDIFLREWRRNTGFANYGQEMFDFCLSEERGKCERTIPRGASFSREGGRIDGKPCGKQWDRNGLCEAFFMWI